MDKVDMQEVCDLCCDEVRVNNQYIGDIFQWLINNGYEIYKIDDKI
jgi:hypothetical protein